MLLFKHLCILNWKKWTRFECVSTSMRNIRVTVSAACLSALIKYTQRSFSLSLYLTLYLCSHRAPGGSTMSSQTQPTTWVTVWRVTKRIIWSSTLLPFNLLWPSCPKTPTLSTATRPPYSLTPHPLAPYPHTPSRKSNMYEYICDLSLFLSLFSCSGYCVLFCIVFFLEYLKN